jgi:hypothetical protein
MSLISHYADIYQTGYVARDIGKAVDFLRAKYGATDFDLKDHDLVVMRDGRPMPLQMRVAIVNIGRMQLEVIEPVGGEAATIYTDGVDFDRSPIVFHHIGIAVPGAYGNWSAMEADVRGVGEDFAMAFAFDHEENPMVRFAYVDTRRHTGHYTEFLWWSPAAAFGNAAFPNREMETA